MSANKELNDAITSAVNEAILVNFINYQLIAEIQAKEDRFNFRAFKNSPFFIHAFLDEFRQKRNHWLSTANESIVNNRNKQFTLNHVVDNFGDIYFKDITTPDISNSGLFVSRVYIPNTITMNQEWCNFRRYFIPSPI